MIEKASGSRTEVDSIVPIVSSSFEYIAALDKGQIESVSGSCVESRQTVTIKQPCLVCFAHASHSHIFIQRPKLDQS